MAVEEDESDKAFRHSLAQSSSSQPTHAAMHNAAMNNGTTANSLPSSQFYGSTYGASMGVLGGALARTSGKGVDTTMLSGLEGGDAMEGIENGHDGYDHDPHRQSDDQLMGLSELTFKGPVIGGVYQHCFEGCAPLIAPPTAAGTHIPSVIRITEIQVAI